ncbi:hypothetical protein C8R45DRAFT_1033915 [Mycena sanguinolenta]|nr:hypothetical protein C8R45DRAFT_1033915 [Mycena sanguinolenta]
MCRWRLVHNLYLRCGHAENLPPIEVKCGNKDCKFSPNHPPSCVPPSCRQSCNQYHQFPEQYTPHLDEVCSSCTRDISQGRRLGSGGPIGDTVISSNTSELASPANESIDARRRSRNEHGKGNGNVKETHAATSNKSIDARRCRCRPPFGPRNETTQCGGGSAVGNFSKTWTASYKRLWKRLWQRSPSSSSSFSSYLFVRTDS